MKWLMRIGTAIDCMLSTHIPSNSKGTDVTFIVERLFMLGEYSCQKEIHSQQKHTNFC